MMCTVHVRPLVFFGALTLSCLVVGCKKEEMLHPVEGKVLVEGQPLHVGSLLLVPDATKDNPGKGTPAADIQKDGTYKVMTAGRSGAPPGWYKVSVVSQEPVFPDDPYKARKTFANDKYIDPEKSQLRLQVVDNPAPGAYDLKLTK